MYWQESKPFAKKQEPEKSKVEASGKRITMLAHQLFFYFSMIQSYTLSLITMAKRQFEYLSDFPGFEQHKNGSYHSSTQECRPAFLTSLPTPLKDLQKNLFQSFPLVSSWLRWRILVLVTQTANSVLLPKLMLVWCTNIYSTAAWEPNQL